MVAGGGKWWLAEVNGGRPKCLVDAKAEKWVAEINDGGWRWWTLKPNGGGGGKWWMKLNGGRLDAEAE